LHLGQSTATPGVGRGHLDPPHRTKRELPKVATGPSGMLRRSGPRTLRGYPSRHPAGRWSGSSPPPLCLGRAFGVQFPRPSHGAPDPPCAGPGPSITQNGMPATAFVPSCLGASLSRGPCAPFFLFRLTDSSVPSPGPEHVTQGWVTRAIFDASWPFQGVSERQRANRHLCRVVPNRPLVALLIQREAHGRGLAPQPY
jgi:hypothetical protein